MNKIKIIGTVHMDIETDVGKHNSNILYDIIKNLNPNIIFEETKPNIYVKAYIYNEKPFFIEHNTIKKYIDKYKIKNIPIDTLEEPSNFLELHEKLEFDIKFRNCNNKELTELMSLIDDYSNNNGIEGVNSEYFDDLINKRHQLYRYYISNYRKNLISCYNEYMDYNCEKRENMMIENILKYIHLNIKDNDLNAVVLIGAAHRINIKNKLQDKTNIECDLLYLD